jgi:hypothetical protein
MMYQGWGLLSKARGEYLSDLEGRIDELESKKNGIPVANQTEDVKYILNAMIEYFRARCNEIQSQYAISDQQLDLRVSFASAAFNYIVKSEFDTLKKSINTLIEAKKYRCGLVSNRFHNILLEYKARSSAVEVLDAIEKRLVDRSCEKTRDLLSGIKVFFATKLSINEGDAIMFKEFDSDRSRWQVAVTGRLCDEAVTDSRFNAEVSEAVRSGGFGVSIFRRTCGFHAILKAYVPTGGAERKLER